ncbi:tRNA epoxyqueuosine(34) reductase QueG [Marinobacterium sp. LSUCC0821]|uniref:tRNA epoxyqueuosine(34) reductase QueG n=1 Tax=Marinobacterium sp. LSUCC0821 TaxID=2668067 RepID=UPI0014511704|nr:tRNA epoxyqueuosine(34) reductase QueG [Marinobacterium sp. LSUCC0821]QJD70300.1 tRNA epoxyqueuosine(34) reductase QueG [Marinobacterium sp. LSUCC0821]
MTTFEPSSLDNLASALKEKAFELGFQQCAITLPDMRSEESYLREWLEKNYQGEMGFLADHFEKRIDPKQLVDGTLRVIMVRMDYLPSDVKFTSILANPKKGYIARYALGRDYHKLIRNRLKHLGQWLEERCEQSIKFRPFVDSAPILERPLARDAGLGWVGKHTLLLNRSAGSWFFLGSLFIDLPLPIDTPESETHCGKCTACMDICPTNAFPAPYVLDARRCISYLTIEHRGSIPEELRPLMGNRIFGCDDCQLICPWNRFAKHTNEEDFSPRHQLDNQDLLELFSWSEEEFLTKTEGSAIRRTGYQGWRRNIAIALGNSADAKAVGVIKEALNAQTETPMVQEHLLWALNQLSSESATQTEPLPLLQHPNSKRIPD